MRAGISGRVKRLEKRVPPTLQEVLIVIDRVVQGTAVWKAAIAKQQGKDTAEHQATLDAFWNNENWYGAKQALDANWPREVWELVYHDHLYKVLGYKDCLDSIGCDIWELETDIRAFAIRSRKEDKPEAGQERMAVYGRFCQLPEDERKQWRQAAKEEVTAVCRTDEHSRQVERLLDQLAQEIRKLEREG